MRLICTRQTPRLSICLIFLALNKRSQKVIIGWYDMWSNSPGWFWKKVFRIDIGDIPCNRRVRKRGKEKVVMKKREWVMKGKAKVYICLELNLYEIVWHVFLPSCNYTIYCLSKNREDIIENLLLILYPAIEKTCLLHSSCHMHFILWEIAFEYKFMHF